MYLHRVTTVFCDDYDEVGLLLKVLEDCRPRKDCTAGVVQSLIGLHDQGKVSDVLHSIDGGIPWDQYDHGAFELGGYFTTLQ